MDIGTTSTKSVAYDVAGQPTATHAVGYPLAEPHPGYAEQDPDVILAAVLATVARSPRGPRARCSRCRSARPCTAHRAGRRGRPADAVGHLGGPRAGAQAERLRATARGLALHRRTGTPIHPMSPLTKLVWFRETEPALCRRVAHWVGIKDYVVSRMCGALVTDHSVASGTGLMDIHRLTWDPEALEIAGIEAGQLPALAATTTVLPGLSAATAGATDCRPRRRWSSVRATDRSPTLASAPCVGGRGVLDRHQRRPAGDGRAAGGRSGGRGLLLCPDRGPLGRRRAINNGGIVLGWAGDALAPDLGPHAEDRLLALAAQVPPGCGGLVMLPTCWGNVLPSGVHSPAVPMWG